MIKTQAWERIKLNRQNLFWHVAIPVAFLLVLLFFFPSRERFEFSSDEGINLMKAMLVEQGYSLYDEIWNDQPPLFTHSLAIILRVAGFRVGAGRLFVAFLSSVLLWAFVQTGRIIWGDVTALAGAFMLFLIPEYISLSVSVMVGLPSISLAMVALFTLILWHRDRKYVWLILSAAALSFSILTKLFTGFLAPIFALGLVVDQYNRAKDDQTSWYKTLIPAFLWGSTLVIITTILAFLFVGFENLPMLVENHLAAESLEIFNQVVFSINYRIIENRLLLFLALLGTVYSIRQKHWLFLYPLTWMLSAYLLLSGHAPVWNHHLLLVTIPAAMLAAPAAVEGGTLLYQFIRSIHFRKMANILRTAAFISLFAIIFTFRPLDVGIYLSPTPTLSGSGLGLGNRAERILFKMIDYASETEWVVTDLPMYAFRARLPVPPQLAVMSLKRKATGNLTEDQVLKTIQEFNPEQVLLGRFEYPSVDLYLEEHYRIIYSKEDKNLYLRNDL